MSSVLEEPSVASGYRHRGRDVGRRLCVGRR